MLINLIMFLKGQRMSEVVLDNHGSSDSRSRWNRVCGLLLTFGLVVMLCGLSAARSCIAQAADQQAGQASDQQAGQASDHQAGQTTDQQTMSAEQIIGILEQAPDLLDSIKSLVAQQPGTDSGTISDQSIYDRIRQDASLRDLVTQELIKRGYSPNPAAIDSNSSNTDRKS